jgi:nitrate reductase NapE component
LRPRKLRSSRKNSLLRSLAVVVVAVAAMVAVAVVAVVAVSTPQL